MLIRPLTATLGAVALSAITACGTSPRVDDRSYGSAPTPVYARSAPYSDYGVVRAIEVVPVSSRPSGAGAILGAIVGGVVGNAIEKRTRRDDEVYRVSVRFEDGSIRDYDYQRIDDLRVGDRVRLVDGQLHYVQ